MAHQQSFLDGKVILYSLPKTADSIGRFKNGCERGEVAMITADDTIEYVEYAEFVSAKLKRGHHYHEELTEKLYVLKGSMIVGVIDVFGNKKQTNIHMKEGDIITIQKNIAHAFFSLEPTMLIIMGYGSRPFEDRNIYKDFDFSKYE
ncbi:hypothetical protein COB57_05695 [Candidatus Peregrinibacteria bacterium]|nr:MAG: hypothetical protein COB57_05695 [Candidatus Peregrinibacteria bacterium]